MLLGISQKKWKGNSILGHLLIKRLNEKLFEILLFKTLGSKGNFSHIVYNSWKPLAKYHFVRVFKFSIYYLFKVWYFLMLIVLNPMACVNNFSMKFRISLKSQGLRFQKFYSMSFQWIKKQQRLSFQKTFISSMKNNEYDYRGVTI